MQAGKKLSWEETGEALLELVVREGLSGAGVAFALPGSAVLRKQLEFPLHFNDSELSIELRQRLSQYFPGIPVEEIHFDFMRRTGSEERPLVLLVATRREQLQTQAGALQKAGLQARIADVDLYALARAAAWYFFQGREGGSEVAALFDLGWPLFSFIAFNRDELIFHHQWRVGREVFEEPLARGADWIPQARNVWQLCQATHPQLRVHYLGVAGELAPLDLIADRLQEHFPLKVEVIRPLRGMTHASSLHAEQIQALSPRFLQCCGLAMRGAA